MHNVLKQRWRELAFLAFLVLGLIVAWTVELPSLEQLRELREQLGPWTVVVFSLLYITVTQFPIPRTALTVSSGVLFGPLLGITVALISTTFAAAVSLTLLRRLLGIAPGAEASKNSWLQRWARHSENHPALGAVTARLEQRGWFSVLCLRLIPGLPFSVLNYACVLTPVRRRDFVVATFFGSAPSTVIGVLLGNSLTIGDGRSVLALLTGLGALGVLGLVVDLLLPVKAKR